MLMVGTARAAARIVDTIKHSPIDLLADDKAAMLSPFAPAFWWRCGTCGKPGAPSPGQPLQREGPDDLPIPALGRCLFR